MEAVMMREDLKCAEEAGVQALESLYTVREKLNSAKNGEFWTFLGEA